MYVEMLKALYETLQAVHLFWKKLSKLVDDWGSWETPMMGAS